jgi:hypothetical protein
VAFQSSNYVLLKWILAMKSSYLRSGLRIYVFVGHSNDGGDQHVIRLVSKMTLPFKFFTFLKSKLIKFVIQNFEAKLQDAQFKSCFDNLTNDQIVTVIDFDDNYSFKEPNAIQFQH